MTEDAADATDVEERTGDAEDNDADAEGGFESENHDANVTKGASDADVAEEVPDPDGDGADAADGDAETGATDRNDAAGDAADGDEPAEPTVDDGLAARVAEYDDDLAADVAELEADLADAESELADAESELAEQRSEIDDLTERLKRKQADFQNYKKRAKKRQTQLKERATEDLVERVVSVRDNLLRALDQDEGTDIRPGVESTLEEFDRVLNEENVESIEPDPGEEVDPTRHQVMMRVESDQPEGTIADVFQPGYEMAGKVIREAQVTVSQDE